MMGMLMRMCIRESWVVGYERIRAAFISFEIEGHRISHHSRVSSQVITLSSEGLNVTAVTALGQFPPGFEIRGTIG